MLMAVVFPHARMAARSEAYTRTLALACPLDQTRASRPVHAGWLRRRTERGGLLHPREIDWVIMVVYFVFVLGVGYALRRQVKTSTDYFLSGRSIPACVAGLERPERKQSVLVFTWRRARTPTALNTSHNTMSHALLP